MVRLEFDEQKLTPRPARRMTHRRKAFLFATFILAASCAPTSVPRASLPGRSLIILDSSTDRLNAPTKFFAHEFAHVHARRSDDGSGRPSQIVGLALSGGGIRATAFHLGVLSGLNRANTLPRVDYVSSVSGGSWANGAYFATRRTDAEFFGCLDQYAETGDVSGDCAFAKNILRSTQRVAPLPGCRWLNRGAANQRKEMWQEDIKRAYLDGDDIDLAQHPLAPHLARKPYPIFNSTHSAQSEFGNASNDPFQITPDAVGTISDRSATFGTPFFASTSAGDLRWQYRKWQRYFALKSENRDDLSGTMLSLVMAHSSGVVGSGKPFLLEFNHHLHYRDQPIAELRAIYHLTDGGKSENLGIVPLLERGVDVVVVSYISDDPWPFKDFTLSIEQSKGLLGCEFPDLPKEPEPVEKISYRCSNGIIGRMLVIRPTTKNVKAFREELARNNASLTTALDAAESTVPQAKRFPFTPTFMTDYDPALIRSYFLLGRRLALEVSTVDQMLQRERKAGS